MDSLDTFIRAKEDIFKQFGIKENYFIKPCLDYSWRIKEIDEMYFLNYWQEGQSINQCVIVKKDGKPMIIKNSNMTMVIAIECIKTAIVLNDENRI